MQTMWSEIEHLICARLRDAGAPLVVLAWLRCRSLSVTVRPPNRQPDIRPVPEKAPAKPRVAAQSEPVAAKKTRTPSAASLRRRAQQMEAKRAQIIEAALALFSRYGLHGTSLDQVATRADVSKTNLLYYFASKEELYLSVLRHLLEVWLLPLKGFSAERDPIEAIGDYLRAKLELSRDRPAESRLFCMEILQGAPLLLGELERPLRELVEAKVAVIERWIADGRLAPVEPHHLIFSLWATTQHYADFSVQVQAVAGGTLDDPAFFEETLDNLRRLFLDGLRPRG